jgi:hypothetical protein
VEKITAKIWELNSPIDRNLYANALPESVNSGPIVDSEYSPEEFTFKWETGSDLIGDCVWPWGEGQITIRKELCDELMQSFSGMNVFAATALGTPRKKGSRGMDVYPVKYCVLWPTHWVSYDETLSTVAEEMRFAGIKLPTIVGAERYEHDYRPLDRVNSYSHVSRVPNKGLFFHRKELLEHNIFRPRKFPGMLLCTDNFKDYFTKRKISNILFLEIGDVID